MYGRENVMDSRALWLTLSLMILLVVCWLWRWVGGLVSILVLVIIRWCLLVYIYHFFYVLQSLLLLFAVLLQCVDDFYCFAFQISRSFLSP